MDEQNRTLSDDSSLAAEVGDRHAAFLALFLASEKEVSGAGYMQPDHFAEAYVDREPAWTGFQGYGG